MPQIAKKFNPHDGIAAIIGKLAIKLPHHRPSIGPAGRRNGWRRQPSELEKAQAALRKCGDWNS